MNLQILKYRKASAKALKRVNKTKKIEWGEFRELNTFPFVTSAENSLLFNCSQVKNVFSCAVLCFCLSCGHRVRRLACPRTETLEETFK